MTQRVALLEELAGRAYGANLERDAVEVGPRRMREAPHAEAFEVLEVFDQYTGVCPLPPPLPGHRTMHSLSIGLQTWLWKMIV